MDKIRVIQYGLGSIGLEIVETLLTRPWVDVVGAVDIDNTKVGKDIGQFLKTPRRTGIIVSHKSDELLKRTNPDVVTHATSPYVKIIYPQLEEILEHRASVISTAGELIYPFVKYPEIAQRLDTLAKSKKKVVLGTGVNPGFVLDTLAVVLSGACQHVTSIRAERIIDAARRLPLHRKIGVGLSTVEFDRQVGLGSVKHVGLPESVGLVALGMGWKVGEIQERLMPVVAEKDIETNDFKIQRGAVSGVRQVSKGILAGQELIVLDLRIFIGAQNPHDSILVEGVPPIDMTIKGGVHGDRATPALVANSISRIESLQPGLRTMIDMPPPSARLDDVSEDRSVVLKSF